MGGVNRRGKECVIRIWRERIKRKENTETE